MLALPWRLRAYQRAECRDCERASRRCARGTPKADLYELNGNDLLSLLQEGAAASLRGLETADVVAKDA